MRRPPVRVWHMFAFLILVYGALGLAVYTWGWQDGRNSVPQPETVVEILDVDPLA